MPDLEERKRRNYDYRIIETEEELGWAISNLTRASTIALDLETSGFDWRKDYVVGWAFSWQPRQGIYIPVAHSTGVQLPHDFVADALRPVLEGDRVTAIHNAKFDTRFVRALGITMPYDQIHDTLLEAFAAADGYQRFGLKELTQAIWKIRQIGFDELFPKRTKNKNIADVMIDLAGEYACEDADFCLRLHEMFFPRVEQKFIYQLESKLWPVVQRIEEVGVKVDEEYVERAADYLEREAEKVAHIVYDQVEAATGQRIEFNLRSSDQLGEVLFDVMKIPARRKTKTGKWVTDAVTFELLKDEWPVCANVLTYRSMRSNAQTLRKMKSAHMNPLTGRIHTQYGQAGATSGRFSSNSPNLQNVSKVKEWEVVRPDGSTYTVKVSPRMALVAGDGYYLLELDFASIEFIVMAALAGQEDIVEFYLGGGDVHKLTASQIYHIPVEEVTPEHRRRAKTYGYLILYGGSAAGLSDRTGGSEEEAAAEIAQFYRSYPNTLRWSRREKQRARSTHRVTTFFGRDQLVPEYKMPGRSAANKAERASVNRIVQGTAADYHKIGLIRTAKVGKELREKGFNAECVLQTHDSQTWLLPRTLHPDVAVPMLAEAMAVDVSGLPRMRVDAEVGTSWYPLAAYEEGMDLEATLERLDTERVAMKESFGASEEEEQQALQARMFDEGEEEPEAKRTVHQRLLVKLGEPKERERAASELLSVVGSFVGGNRVVVVAEGIEHELDLGTSLTERTLADALRPIFPDVEVKADRDALMAGVMAGIVNGGESR